MNNSLLSKLANLLKQPESLPKPVTIENGLFRVYPDGAIERRNGNWWEPIRITRTGKKGQQYASTSAKVDGRQKNYLIHRLIATALIPNPKNLLYVIHKDGDAFNNSPDNLCWARASIQNTPIVKKEPQPTPPQRKASISTAGNAYLAKAVPMTEREEKIIKLRKKGLICEEIGRKVGLSRATVSKTLRDIKARQMENNEVKKTEVEKPKAEVMFDAKDKLYTHAVLSVLYKKASEGVPFDEKQLQFISEFIQDGIRKG